MSKPISVTLLNKFNDNGRKYSIEVLKSAFKEYRKDIVKNGRSLGTFHPEKYNVDSSILISEVSHIIRNLRVYKKQKYVKSRIQILNTPNGKLLSECLSINSDKISFKPRFIGRVDSDNKVCDLQLISIDAVIIKD